MYFICTYQKLAISLHHQNNTKQLNQNAMTFNLKELTPGSYTLIGVKNGIAIVMEKTDNNSVIFNRYWNETGELLFETLKLN